MPIKVQGDLPAKGILENENIFVMAGKLMRIIKQFRASRISNWMVKT